MTRPSLHGSSLLLAACVLGLQAEPAWAQGQAEATAPVATATKSDDATRAAARTAFNDGVAAYDRADYAGAAVHFRRANELIPTAQARLRLAESLDKAGNASEAIAAYEAFLNGADVTKVADDKVSVARLRLDELKAAQQPAPAPEPVAAEPAPVAQPAPAPAPPPAEPAAPMVAPPEPEEEVRRGEVGAFVGPLWMADSHDLRDEAFARVPFTQPMVLFGLRGAYFPVPAFGLELHWAHAEATVEPSGRWARINMIHGNLVGQLPLDSVKLFALVGAGLVRISSLVMGESTEGIARGAVGAKVDLSKRVLLRLDLGAELTAANGGGIAFSPEVLLGGAVTF